MGKLLQQFGETVAAFTHHPIVEALTLALTIYVVIVWLATAYWAFRDLRRRHPNPALPYLAAAGVIIASPVLFPLAVVVYRIVRPGETFFEARERELADRLELLNAEMDVHCPGCEQPVEESWLACPLCRTRLGHRCLECGRVMGLDWDLCAWCGAEFGRAGATQPVVAAAVQTLIGPAEDKGTPAGDPAAVGVDRGVSGGRRQRRAQPEAARV